MESTRIPDGEYTGLAGAMEALGLSKGRVHQLILKGKLNPYRIGQFYVFDLEDLAAFRIARMERAQAALDKASRRAEGVGHDS